ncbi:MAG: EamA family transporter [Candidatus Diapherotrites archaeon]|nr:EamA family transporter [Candidatus Diapherotrites archaeon]
MEARKQTVEGRLNVSWFLFVLVSSIGFACANVIDKFVLSNKIRNAALPVVIEGFLGVLVAVAVVFVHGVGVPAWPFILLAMLIGVGFTLSVLFYFRAVQRDEVSRVIPLYELLPLVVLVLSVLFLGESFSGQQVFGMVLLVAGAVLISVHDFKALKFSRALGWVGLSLGIASVDIVLTGFLLRSLDFWTVFAWGRMGSLLTVIPLAFFHWKPLREVLVEPKRHALSWVGLSEWLTLAGLFLFTVAASMGPVALVSAVYSLQPLWVFALATMVSIVFPGLLKEKVHAHALIQKAAAILLIYIGVGLVV